MECKCSSQDRGQPYLRSVIRTSIPGKKNFFETNAYFRAAVEIPAADRDFRPDDNGHDRYPRRPSQLLDCQVVIGLSRNYSRLSWLTSVLPISLSYDSLSPERLMRTFLGLPLVAAILDVTSSI